MLVTFGVLVSVDVLATVWCVGDCWCVGNNLVTIGVFVTVWQSLVLTIGDIA